MVVGVSERRVELIGDEIDDLTSAVRFAIDRAEQVVRYLHFIADARTDESARALAMVYQDEATRWRWSLAVVTAGITR